MGTGLPAMASLRFNRQTAVFASQASQLPQAERCAHNLQFPPPQPLWERAYLRWHPCGLTDRPQCLHRRQASSHRQSGARAICNSPPPTFVGAGLPAMASLRFNRQTAVFASQASQLPQVVRCAHNLQFPPQPLWERACPRWQKAQPHRLTRRFQAKMKNP